MEIDFLRLCGHCTPLNLLEKFYETGMDINAWERGALSLGDDSLVSSPISFFSKRP